MFDFLSPSLNWRHYLRSLQRRAGQLSRPREMLDSWSLADGTAVVLRAARPDDGPKMQELVHSLSITSRYRRFFHPVNELPPQMVERFTHNHATDAVTLLAVIRNGDHESAIAMAQYVAEDYPERCDFAVVVADHWQRAGIGTRLVQALICIARAAGIGRIEGDVLTENEPMRRMMRKMGFTLARHDEGPALRKAVRELGVPEWKCSPLTALAAQTTTMPLRQTGG